MGRAHKLPSKGRITVRTWAFSGFQRSVTRGIRAPLGKMWAVHRVPDIGVVVLSHGCGEGNVASDGRGQNLMPRVS
jgi:hypothetical protein